MKTFYEIVEETLKEVNEIDIYQLKKILDEKENIKLIDIREDREWVNGKIPSSTHIGRGVLEKGLPEVAAVDDKIILYCAGGYRSVLACKSITQMGFKESFSLKGGITDWISAGFEVEE
tara:strand:- start:4821 stop:5177 length:357 start_codon:yes stop_codon:yes gene_type:complete